MQFENSTCVIEIENSNNQSSMLLALIYQQGVILRIQFFFFFGRIIQCKKDINKNANICQIIWLLFVCCRSINAWCSCAKNASNLIVCTLFLHHCWLRLFNNNFTLIQCWLFAVFSATESQWITDLQRVCNIINLINS